MCAGCWWEPHPPWQTSPTIFGDYENFVRLKSHVLFLMHILRVLLWPGTLSGWPLELGCRVCCCQGVCVPLTRPPQALGHSLGHEREEEWLMKWGGHKTEHSTISSQLPIQPKAAFSCSQGSHLGHTTCTPGLRDGTGVEWAQSTTSRSVCWERGTGAKTCCHWQVTTLLFQFF